MSRQELKYPSKCFVGNELLRVLLSKNIWEEKHHLQLEAKQGACFANEHHAINMTIIANHKKHVLICKAIFDLK